MSRTIHPNMLKSIMVLNPMTLELSLASLYFVCSPIHPQKGGSSLSIVYLLFHQAEELLCVATHSLHVSNTQILLYLLDVLKDQETFQNCDTQYQSSLLLGEP